MLSIRDRCYHAISRDLSARPHEILNLRIKDVNFKLVGNSQYAEVIVSGKTCTRPIPLISSLPYLKDWWDDHPQRGNPSAFLIPSFDRRNYCRRMSVIGLHHIYCNHYKQNFFPRLLEDHPDLPSEDRQHIKEMLQKRCNPYVRRHSALTEKSTILKEHALRQHAGWSGRSQIHLKYLHYFGNVTGAVGYSSRDDNLKDDDTFSLHRELSSSVEVDEDVKRSRRLIPLDTKYVKPHVADLTNRDAVIFYLLVWTRTLVTYLFFSRYT